MEACGAGWVAVATLLDIVDAGLDLALVNELVDNNHRSHAVWLAIQVIIATVFHFLARARLRQDIDSGRKEGFAAVATFASIELIVFLQEDTTTLMVWWQTGLYNEGSLTAYANLIITIASGCLVSLLVLADSLAFACRIDVAIGCNAALVGVVSLAPIAFWVFFATQYIAEGRHPDEHVPEDKEHDLDSPSLMSVYSSIVYAIPYVMSFVWGASFVLSVPAPVLSTTGEPSVAFMRFTWAMHYKRAESSMFSLNYQSRR